MSQPAASPDARPLENAPSPSEGLDATDLSVSVSSPGERRELVRAFLSFGVCSCAGFFVMIALVPSTYHRGCHGATTSAQTATAEREAEIARALADEAGQ